MAAEKNFENRVKNWLMTHGIYPLGCAVDRMTKPPVGYFEKRWGGGYSKSGLPDMHIVVNGINLDVELKSSTGRPSELQKHCIRQINACGSIGIILYPDRFEDFKKLVKGVLDCNGHTAELNALRVAGVSTSCDILTG